MQAPELLRMKELLFACFAGKRFRTRAGDYDAESAFCVRKELGSTMEGVAGGGVNVLAAATGR